MKLEFVVRKDVSHVELVNDEWCTLGIAIRDGMDDEAGPVIKRIKPKSVAERSYAVAEGDVILSLNDRQVMGVKGKEIQCMLKEIGPNIELKVQYEIREACVSRSGVYRKHQMTTKLLKMGGSFGFVLRKKKSRHPAAVEYPFISNIKPEGPADKDGLMHDGDRLVKVDDVNLSWLSLPDIAIVLQERDEAEFTFEYNIRVLDFPKPEEGKIDLTIDIPNMDLGIGFCTHPMASHVMCIGSIRLGSVAERCGVFYEEDIILSVNGIDVEFLTVSKANSLLRYARKNRKISFLSAKGRELNPVVPHNSPSEQSVVTSPTSIGIQTRDYKHHNTPANSSSTLSTGSKSRRQICPREQVKAIKTFQDIMKHMTELKQSLSHLTCEAFDANKPFNEICTCCNITQHSVKLCASCLANMNVKCAESMDIIGSLIARFIAVSIDSKHLQSPDDSRNPLNDIYKNPSESGVSRNLIHSLKKTLPDIFANKPELKKAFYELAEKIFNADTTCNSCKNDINSVSVTVQKLLLLVSLNADTTEIRDLINQVVHLLLDTKLACDGDASALQAPEDNECRSQTQRSDLSVLPSIGGTRSSKSASKLPQNVIGPQLNVSESNDYEKSGNGLNNQTLMVNQNKVSDYFRISNVQNSSESDNDLDDIYELNVMNLDEVTPLVDSNGSSLKADGIKDSIAATNSEVLSKIKKIYKDKGIASTPAKVWRSLDSFLTLKKSPQNRSVINRNDLNNSSQDHRNTDEKNPVSAEVSFRKVIPHSSSALESSHLPGSNKRNNSESNTDSEASSYKDSVRNRGSTASEKIHRETVDVKMINDGKGFGFVLGYSSPNFSQTLPIPIITSIKPKSPAEKVGILQTKDRVLAIDHKSTVNMQLDELESVKRRVHSSEKVILTIEFDVTDAQMKFGTFDVMLEKKLKIGLLFNEMKEGHPLVVSGVVKGSAAYRSGQLFPGDKVTFLKCFRKEEFDPIPRSYIKEETVKITVQRDPTEGVKESPIKSIPSHSNPFSFNPRPDLQSGKKFILKRTSIRPVERTDSLVLEQEVTLFRDPISWDFGFLVGENPETGQAYVTDLKQGGPASASGVIKKFDMIIEVNGVAVGKSEERSVLSLLTQANDKMDLLIRRLYHEEMNNVTLKTSRF